MEEKLKKYRESVEYCAKTHYNNMLHNEGNDHALIIFENMFKYAKKKIRIAAKDMANIEVVNTERYVDAMKIFLDKKGSELCILLSTFNNNVNNIEENNFFKMLINSNAYKENRVVIKHLNGKSFKANGKPVHFCTADSIAYRVERDIDRRIAHGNFGDNEITKKYEDMFDRVFQNGDISFDVRLESYLN